VSDLRRLIITALAFLASGCAVQGPFGDKAGGVPGGKVVLRLANVSSQLQERPAVAYFIRRVEVLSGGNISIRVLYNWKSPQRNAEQEVVRATAAGTSADLGVVGTRVFDTMGVSSLQALTAPMLVDSYPLENAVLHSRIPTHMLAGVARLGVTGLALIGNGMRKPVAVKKPLLGPKDWRGIRFGTYLSKLQEDAIRALGATPVVAFSALRTHYLQTGLLTGFEMNALTYYVNGYWSQARFITANVNLWPQVDVLVANPSVLAHLTPQQRGWLEQAAREAADRSATMMSRAESMVTPTICSRGARFVNASGADLASLRKAFAALYARLERDAQTKSFIARIQSMKPAVPAGPTPAIPKGCG
jgi:TRAP-type C4-dicarboxylate transport system substrate-binding protein